MKLNKTSQMPNIPSSSLLGSLLKLQKEILNPKVGSVDKICGEWHQTFWCTYIHNQNGRYIFTRTTSSTHLPVNDLK